MKIFKIFLCLPILSPLFFLHTLFIISSIAQEPDEGLKLLITDIKVSEGQLIVAVFSSKNGFPEKLRWPAPISDSNL